MRSGRCWKRSTSVWTHRNRRQAEAGKKGAAGKGGEGILPQVLETAWTPDVRLLFGLRSDDFTGGTPALLETRALLEEPQTVLWVQKTTMSSTLAIMRTLLSWEMTKPSTSGSTEQRR